MVPARPRRPRPPLAAGALGLALVATNGCSFVILHPAPARADWPDPVTPHSSQTRCTRSPAPPVIDTTITVGLGAIAVLGEKHSSTPYFPPLVFAAAVPYLASAVYGYWTVNHCRNYQQIFADQAEREQK